MNYINSKNKKKRKKPQQQQLRFIKHRHLTCAGNRAKETHQVQRLLQFSSKPAESRPPPPPLPSLREGRGQCSPRDVWGPGEMQRRDIPNERATASIRPDTPTFLESRALVSEVVPWVVAGRSRDVKGPSASRKRGHAQCRILPNLKLADHTLSSRHDQLPTLHPLQGGPRTGDHPGHTA